MVLSNIIYFLIVVILFYYVFKSTIDLFHVLIFVMPFQSWRYDVGLSITAFQIVLVLLIAINSLNNNYKRKNIFNFYNPFLVLYLFYVAILTIIISVFFISYSTSDGGFFRSTGRFLSQIFLYFTILLMVPISFNYVNSFEKLLSYFKIWIISLLVLSFLGLIQFFVYTYFSLDLFPIAVKGNGSIRSGLWSNSDLVIFRINSLGGEPKGFSMSLILGYFIISIFNDLNFNFFKYDKSLKFIFLILAFISLSTSAIVLFFLLYFINLFLLPGKDRYRKIFLFLFSTIFLLLIFIQIPLLNELIKDRLLERDLLREDYDATIQNFLLHNPIFLIFGTGLGNVHFLAKDYIPIEYMYYMENSIFVAKSGYLRIVSELGLIGALFFSFVFFFLYRQLLILKPFFPVIYSIFISLTILFLFAYLSRAYVFNELILILSLSTAAYRIFSFRIYSLGG